MSNQCYVALGNNSEMTAGELYYNPPRPSAFSNLEYVAASIPKKNKLYIRAWLELKDAYTQHRPVRRRFLRKQYTFPNVMDVWECDLLDVQSLAKYNDMHRYIVTVIDVYPKYLHLVPVKTKRGPSIASAFRSIFHDDSRRPVWVRTDKGKELRNINFKTCYLTRAFSFKSANIQMSNVRSWYVLIGRSEIDIKSTHI